MRDVLDWAVSCRERLSDAKMAKYVGGRGLEVQQCRCGFWRIWICEFGGFLRSMMPSFLKR